jgi:hypothetical protein
VPIITSIWPSCSFASAASTSFFDLNREMTSTRTGQSAKRSRKFW